MAPKKRIKRNATAAAPAAMPSPSAGASHASDASPTVPMASNSGTPAASQQPPELSFQQGKPTDMSSPSPRSSQKTISDPSALLNNEPAASQARKAKSWYGSWPRVPKSSASTQVAGETIQGRTLRPRKTADFSKYDTKKAGDTNSIDTANSHTSTSTLPNLIENETGHERGLIERMKVDNKGPFVEGGQNGGQVDIPKPMEDVDVGQKDGGNDGSDTEQRVTTETESALELPGVEPSVPAVTDNTDTQQLQQPATSTSWLGPLGWWGRPTIGVKPEAPEEPAKEESTNPAEEIDVDPPLPEIAPEAQAVSEPEGQSGQESTQTQVTVPRSSWFGLWSNSVSTPTQSSQTPEPAAGQSGQPDKPAETGKEPEDMIMKDAPIAEEPVKEPTKDKTPKTGSTWAFWSRDTNTKSKGAELTQKENSDDEEGQLAVMGESSESQPQLQKTKSITIEGTPPKEPPVRSPGSEDSTASSSWLGTSPAKGSIKAKKSKKLRPQSMDLDQQSIPSRPQSPKPESVTKVEPPSVKAGSSKVPTAATTATTTKPAPSNLVLPSFKGTYRMKDNPSIIKQISQLLLRTQQSPANHVFLAKETPKIHKALAIGVHGLFPATYLKAIIGQPTGTSIKFANHAANSIRRWADKNGSPDCEIEKVALEGEGKIGERVENLWKLLLNWIDTIRAADLIIIACHSQGVPVSIMLLAKLIELGVISNSTRVGVCAMAGVSLGPFPDYRSGMGMLMGSAAELWEFSNPQSDISKRLEASVKAVLNHGARISFTGSIDDQLVPLESAIYSPAQHPYIYRSVFIDGRIHAPDFIAHLVGFALKLRNLGVTDHGLIRELSLPLAGSLYSGEGHSRLYDDEQVYE